jgi:hypothetical protein
MLNHSKRQSPMRVERFLSKAELEKRERMWRLHDEARAKVALRACPPPHEREMWMEYLAARRSD